MPVAFSRTLRSIEADGGGAWRLGAPLVLLSFGAWGWWMARAEVPLFVASREARLVREGAVHAIESMIDGRVVALHVALEESVEPGTLLVELDASAQELALAEELARRQSLEAEIASARVSVAALTSAREEAAEAAEDERRQAELELAARRLARSLAWEEAERLAQLEESGTVSELTVLRAHTQAQQADLAVEVQEAALQRLAADRRRDDADRAAELAERQRGLSGAEGALAVLGATVERLEHERELCRVRSPAAGSVAELLRLAPGSYVRAGEKLGSVVAAGRLAAEAEFEPAEVLGKVRLGQRGELSLAGFPRVQYGALPVEVARIASEARDGRIHVELTLLPAEGARMPLEHGLPGALEIEIERVHPAVLVWRAVGGAFGLRRARTDG